MKSEIKACKFFAELSGDEKAVCLYLARKGKLASPREGSLKRRLSVGGISWGVVEGLLSREVVRKVQYWQLAEEYLHDNHDELLEVESYGPNGMDEIRLFCDGQWARKLVSEKESKESQQLRLQVRRDDLYEYLRMLW